MTTVSISQNTLDAIVSAFSACEANLSNSRTYFLMLADEAAARNDGDLEKRLLAMARLTNHAIAFAQVVIEADHELIYQTKERLGANGGAIAAGCITIPGYKMPTDSEN